MIPRKSSLEGSASGSSDDSQLPTASPLSSSGSVDSRFIKIEKMRNRRFDPVLLDVTTKKELTDGSAVETNHLHTSSAPDSSTPVPAAAQIALFREDAKRRMANRLTKILEGTREEDRARQRARELVKARLIESFDMRKQKPAGSEDS